MGCGLWDKVDGKGDSSQPTTKLLYQYNQQNYNSVQFTWEIHKGLLNPSGDLS